MPKQYISSDLRERFSLEFKTQTYTSGQEDTPIWNVLTGFGSCPAMIEYESEFERIRAGRNESLESVKVVVRKEIPVTPQHTIVWRSERFQVVGYPQFTDSTRHFKKFAAVRSDIPAASLAGVPGGFQFNDVDNSSFIPLT